jgi:dUTPase
VTYELNTYNTVYKFLGGVIDSDYRGDKKRLLKTMGQIYFTIKEA